MVMEASPSPQSVGREFVRQYYTLLNKAPAHLHRFYNNYSSFVHGGLDAPNRETLPVIGQKQIHNRIQQLNFRDCHAKISQVDSQATLGNGVVVQVTGELSNGGAPMRRFTQTFVLAAQSPKKYYVHNDIFRYQDIVFSDDSGSGSARSDAEEEEPRGYFPPAAPAPAAPAPAPVPAAPAPGPAPSSPEPCPAPFPAPPVLPPPHLNGHQQVDDSTRHLVAALQASGLGVPAERERERDSPAMSVSAVSAVSAVGGSGEGEEPLSPPEIEAIEDPAPAPPSAPEPKTYANLVKSGVSSQPAPPSGGPLAAIRHSPPQMGVQSSIVHESRPRPQRPPRDNHLNNSESSGGGGGGGSGSGGGSGGGGGATRRYSDSQQLFLGNLPHSATEEALRALFSKFGPVADLRVHAKPPSHLASPHPAHPARYPNYGFITYESELSARDCLNAAPLYFPLESGEGVKLNVEEKKARGREAPPPRRRPPSAARPPFPRNYRR